MAPPAGGSPHRGTGGNSEMTRMSRGSIDLCVLASGSAGNCTLLRTPGGVVLIDAGIGPRTVSQRLAGTGVAASDVAAVCLTHLDRDHIDFNWFNTFVRRRTPVFCHAHVLESVADLIRSGGYLGAFSLLDRMPEVQQFRDATEYVLARTPDRQSIVLTSILSALEGRFGNHQRTDRTADSELFINPLMAFYWCFQLEQVAKRVLYLEGAAEIDGYVEFQGHIATFQREFGQLRPWKDLPM